MIITSLKAENILKYAKLDLNDLPEKGLIGISGPNESGKSSIGEALCFAFFGRTFALDAENLDKLVRWGETHCSVTVEFKVKGQIYQLSRYLDADGNHSARLCQGSDTQHPIARGVEGVADALFERIGFEFDEFIESFYLAQREITTPHPHSQAVKIMAGVFAFEVVGNELDEEIAAEQESMAEIEAELDDLRQQEADLGLEPGRLEQLAGEQSAARTQAEAIEQAVETLNEATGQYADNAGEIESLQGGKGTASFFRFVFLLLALAGGAAWFLLGPGPQMAPEAAGLAAQLKELLTAQIPQWQDTWIPFVGYGAIGCAVLMILAWISASSKAGQIAALREQSVTLADAMEAARVIEGESPAEAVEETAEDAAEADESAPADVAGEAEPAGETEQEETESRPDQDEYRRLHPKVANAEAFVGEVRGYVEREAGGLRQMASQKIAHADALQADIEQEQDRLRQAESLQRAANAIADKVAKAERRIQVRELAIEMSDAASREVSSSFNREIKDLVGKTLPLFTQGRYEHLLIDEALGVRVFSAEKRDFMDLDEVSSGTQRQIMLALRLALSEKLLQRAVKGKQFAFLDEPFAFFDATRTRQSLASLAKISDDLAQIWVVGQEFPSADDCVLDLEIHCEREADQVRMGSSGSAPELEFRPSPEPDPAPESAAEPEAQPEEVDVDLLATVKIEPKD